MSVAPNIEMLTGIITGAAARSTWIGIAHDAFWQEAGDQGVAPLVAAALAASPDAPAALRGVARERTHRLIAADLLREAELQELLAALAAASVDALLIKGALLAYTHYPRPDLRPRLDTDLIIPAARRSVAHDVLVALGYEPDVQASGDCVLHQRAYVKRLHDAPVHVVDVHWRLANPEVFRHVLSFEQMASCAVAIPALGAAARGLSDVHALLVSCVHRVAHHFDDDRLIWLYDIHLIARRLEAEAWTRFAALAVERRVAAVCRAGLQKAIERFATPVPAWVCRQLAPDAVPGGEVTAAYLTRKRPHVKVVMDDLRALPTWTDRGRLMFDYAFPPVEYMRKIYAPASTTPLVWLYARRMLFGAGKWLARS